MSSGIPTRQRLFCQLEEIDGLLKELLEKINRKARFDDVEHIVLSLLEKDKEIKETMRTVSKQMEVQIKIEKLRLDCDNSDLQISRCQKQLKKCELLLSTALYYSRQKLDAMVKAVKNPTDVDDLIKFAHRISCSYGALAPDNWVPGDPRRPYPNKEEIRRGYLGHLDDSGKFLPTLRDAVSQLYISVNTTPASMPTTPALTEAVANQQVLASSNQTINPNLFPSETLEGPRINAPPPSSNVGGAGQWMEQQQLRHPPSSLTAMLSADGVNSGLPQSGFPESPSSKTPWQQQLRQGLPGVHSSTPPQPNKRQNVEDSRMCCDNSDDDTRIGDFSHHCY